MRIHWFKHLSVFQIFLIFTIILIGLLLTDRPYIPTVSRLIDDSPGLIVPIYILFIMFNFLLQVLEIEDEGSRGEPNELKKHEYAVVPIEEHEDDDNTQEKERKSKYKPMRKVRYIKLSSAFVQTCGFLFIAIFNPDYMGALHLSAAATIVAAVALRDVALICIWKDVMRFRKRCFYILSTGLFISLALAFVIIINVFPTMEYTTYAAFVEHALFYNLAIQTAFTIV